MTRFDDELDKQNKKGLVGKRCTTIYIVDITNLQKPRLPCK